MICKHDSARSYHLRQLECIIKIDLQHLATRQFLFKVIKYDAVFVIFHTITALNKSETV